MLSQHQSVFLAKEQLVNSIGSHELERPLLQKNLQPFHNIFSSVTNSLQCLKKMGYSTLFQDKEQSREL